MREPLPHPIAEIREAVVHRVFQRNEANCADIPFELVFAELVSGIVEARAASLSFSTPWRTLGQIEDAAAFRGVLPDIPVGQISLEIRVTTDEGTASVTVDPLFVGDLWILAGQSNMEGCGKLIHCETPQPGISCFYMGDRWDIAQDPLCWLNESLDPVNWTVPPEELEQAVKTFRRDRTYGGGLGIPFAKEVIRHTGIPIGLIMCAHGGTSMTQWNPANADGDDGVTVSNSLYGAMLRKIRKLGGKVKGCLWYQGESDANSEATPLYMERMLTFINRVRQDVGDIELPFIYAQLSILHLPDDHFQGWNRIQNDQLLLESALNRVGMAVTIDATMSDAIHVDTLSLKRLGHRMAWQAMDLAYDRPVAKPGPRPERYEWNEQRTELVLTIKHVNGQLADVERVFGFHVEDEGISLPVSGTIADGGRAVRLAFERPVSESALLWHGFGFNPTVNVVDAEGIPLCVFGPVQI